jgi:hypothetical protein
MEDRASQMPPGYYFDKNSRHTVSGERLLRKRIQRIYVYSRSEPRMGNKVRS